VHGINAKVNVDMRCELRYAGEANLVSECLPAIFVLDSAVQREFLVGREGAALCPR